MPQIKHNILIKNTNLDANVQKLVSKQDRARQTTINSSLWFWKKKELLSICPSDNKKLRANNNNNLFFQVSLMYKFN